MKLKLVIFSLLAILVASCTREPLPVIMENEGGMVTINVSISPETRVSFTDGPDNGQSTLAWQEGDKLLLAGYNGATYIGSSLFTWNGGNSFSGDPIQGASPTTTYKAYYPGDKITLDGSGNVQPLATAFWQQIQSGNGTTSHLRNTLLLFDEVANLITEQFELALKSTIIRFKLNLDNISANLGTSQTLIWTVTTTGGVTRAATLNINNYTHAPGEVLTAFLAFDPTVMNIAANGKVKIMLIGSKTYEWSKDVVNSVTYAAGKRYRAAVSSADTWTEVVPFTFTIRLDQPQTYEIWQKTINSTSPGNLTIDWGDGSTTPIAQGASLPNKAIENHSYTSAGDYTITIYSDQTNNASPQMPQITFYNSVTGNGDTNLTAVLTPFPCIGDKYFEFSRHFQSCTQLTSIPGTLFKNNPEVKSFEYCFNGCTSLNSIPADLFKYNEFVQYFGYCFLNCTSLTSIPADLFRHNSAVQSYNYCFSNCSNLTTLPEGLFHHVITTQQSVSFEGCFYNCVKLVLIPEIFPDPATNPDFFNHGRIMTFKKCFENVGYAYSVATGTAPELWRFNGGGNGGATTWTITDCFKGTYVTNYSSIPNSWKGL